MVRNINDLDSTQQEPSIIESLPILTRYWFGATAGITILANLEVLFTAENLYYSWPLIREKYEIYRLLAPFLYAGGFSFNLLITLLCLYQHSKAYESRSVYNTGAGGGTADYAFMLMFGMAMTFISKLLLPIPPFFCRNLVYFVLYVYSKRHPNEQANVWGVPVGAAMLPFAVLGLQVLMGNYWLDIARMAVGHLYYFLVDVYPRVYQKDILHTPDFLINYFGTGEYVPPTPATTRTATGETRPLGAQQGGGSSGFTAYGNRATNSNTSSGHNWGGGGRALGDN